jgi:hypothetical protein
VRTGTDFAVLSQTLDRLKWYKPDEVSPQEETREATRVLSPPLAGSGSEMGVGGSTIVGESTPPKFVHVTHV